MKWFFDFYANLASSSLYHVALCLSRGGINSWITLLGSIGGKSEKWQGRKNYELTCKIALLKKCVIKNKFKKMIF